MLSIVTTIIVFLVILTVIVLIHEAGHFFTALFFGMKVEEFGLGFPPRAWSFKRRGIVYSVNWIPIGGFVKLFGEDDAGAGKVSFKHEAHVHSHETAKPFVSWPAWKRFTTIIAGVVMNFVLAVVLITYLFTFPGVTLPQAVKIDAVQPNSPAAKLNMKKNDTILSVNGHSVFSSDDFIAEVQKDEGKSIVLVTSRNGQQITQSVTPRKVTSKNEGPIGIEIQDIVSTKKYPWYEAPFYGTWEALKFSWMIVTGLVGIVHDAIFSGAVPKGVAGPVGVAELTGQAVQYGFNAVMWFVALLSLNLAVMNVLPIPALDGGRLFFILIEMVTGHRVSQKYEQYTHTVGMALLLTLMVLITFSDVMHLVAGKSILTP